LIGVIKNLQEAFRYFKLSADQGKFNETSKTLSSILMKCLKLSHWFT
jgi:TPR repeat protein